VEVTIKIPEKYKRRNLWVFAGMDPVARYLQDKGYWEVKTDICVRCGKCCRAIGIGHPMHKYIGVTPDGCRALVRSGNEYLCDLGVFRPYRCAVGQNDTVGCNVKWERLND
jgi:hypothetical protein